MTRGEFRLKWLGKRHWSGVQGDLRREAMYYRLAFWITVTTIAVYCWSEVFINYMCY